jgi:hypothetical protein
MSFSKGGMYLATFVSLLILGAGCAQQSKPMDNTSTHIGDPAEAYIDSVELKVLEPFPVQVRAQVKGYISKCVKLNDPAVERSGNVIKVTYKPVFLTVCKEPNASVSFDQTVDLPVQGLPKGTYAVDVNGVKKEFTLDVDNGLNNK